MAAAMLDKKEELDNLLHSGAVLEAQLEESEDRYRRFFDEDRQYTRVRVNKLVKQGWLTRVKKGVYVISDLSTRGSLAISHKAVVNLLVQEAYISFETALQHYGLYDQLLNNITAVSIKQFKTTKIERISFKFIKTQLRYFYGWETQEIDGQTVKIAHPEKALIDLLQFHRSRYSTDLVLEKLRNFQADISHARLVAHALKSNVATRRILGFLMDCAAMNTEQLLDSVRNSTSVSSISKAEGQIYNHKWRLYYDRHFEQYRHE